MGNCQAIDNASLVIQHPGGKSEMLYWPISANEVMKLNPGHYVALLLTTTLYSSPTTAATATTTTTTIKQNNSTAPPSNNNNQPLRVTRIKLLRPTDMLTLGHAYRLITTQEVMKGLWEKKHGKMRKKVQSEAAGKPERMRSDSEKRSSDYEKTATRSESAEKNNQVKKQEKQRPRTSSASSSRGWHPSLKSISEASS